MAIFLFSQLLKHDPQKRLPLVEVLKHSWVLENAEKLPQPPSCQQPELSTVWIPLCLNIRVYLHSLCVTFFCPVCMKWDSSLLQISVVKCVLKENYDSTCFKKTNQGEYPQQRENNQLAPHYVAPWQVMTLLVPKPYLLSPTSYVAWSVPYDQAFSAAVWTCVTQCSVSFWCEWWQHRTCLSMRWKFSSIFALASSTRWLMYCVGMWPWCTDGGHIHTYFCTNQKLPTAGNRSF